MRADEPRRQAVRERVEALPQEVRLSCCVDARVIAVECSEHAVGPRIGLLVAAMVLFGLGSALYLGAWMGAGPRDSLMVVGAHRLHRRLGVVRAGLEVVVLGLGFALGGTIGIGTVVFALTIGPAVEAGFWLVRRADLATGS